MATPRRSTPTTRPTAGPPPVLPGPGHRGRRIPRWALSIFGLGALCYVALFVSAVTGGDTELLQALTIAPILIGLTIPLALRIARREGDATLTAIVMAGAVAKLLGAALRYYVAFNVYHGSTDAAQYDTAARSLAPDFRRFVLTTDIPSIVGTGFIKVVTGVVYAIFGMSKIGGFLVFAWLGFLGLLLFARAFRIAIPEGDSRRYLLLVLFLPSLLYWPAAIGKEAWMMLGIGLCAYGVACIFQGRTAGVLSLALGMAAILLVRPHVSLVIFVGLVLALLVRKVPARSYAAPLFRVLGLAVLLVLGLFLTSQTASFLGQSSLTADSVNTELTQAQVRTGEGGSAFTPVTVTLGNPLTMVPAFITVFIRPFPFETPSAQGLLTSGEGLLVLGLLVTSRKRLRSIPRLIRTHPYVAFCVGYVLAFVFAFSSFGNFGILARERVQALPFLLALVALPRFQRAATPSPSLHRRANRRIASPPRPTEPATRRRARRPLPVADDSPRPHAGP